jgi:PAS domain S-box-containing protein
MTDLDKSKEQLIEELNELRRRVAEQAKLLDERERKAPASDGMLSDTPLTRSVDNTDIFKAVVDASNEAIAVADPGGNLLYVNQAHERLFGKTLEEARHLNYRDYYPPESVRILNDEVAPALERGESWEGELDVYGAGGRLIRLWERADTVRDENGRMRFAFGLMHDVTDRLRAKEALEESEQRYRALFHEAINPILVVNDEGRYLYANKAALDFLECSLSELRSKCVWDWNPPGTDDEVIRQKHSPFTERRTLETEYFVNGQVKTLLLNVFPLKTREGTVLYGIGQNITERKQAEKELKASEEKYRALFDGASDAIFVQDLQGRFIDINRVTCDRLGYTKEELLGKTPAYLDTPDQHAKIAERMETVTKKGSLVFESCHLTKDGTGIPVDVRLQYITYNGRPAIMSMARDISDRKQAEEYLRQGKEKLEALLNATTDVALLLDLEGTILAANQPAGKILGKHQNEIEGLSVYDLLPDELGRSRGAEYRKSILSGKPVRWLDTQGDIIFDNNLFPIFDAEGNVEGAAVFARDVTQAKLSEQALFESEQKYRSLYSAMAEGVALHRLIYDDEGQPSDYMIIDVNPAYEKITGISRAQAAGSLASDLYNTNQAPFLDTYVKVVTTGSPTTFDVYWPPRERHFEICAFSYGQDKFATAFSDITERKRAEDALRRSEERYRGLFEQSTEAILVVRPEGTIIDANPSCVTLFGASYKEVVGSNILDFYADPAARKDIRERLEQSGTLREHSWTVLRKDGTRRQCILNSSVWRNHKGTIVGYISTARDVTEEKELEEQLFRAQKMEAVGTLAGGIAHDFNNLLHVILGYADLALLDVEKGEKAHPELTEIKQAATRASELTQGLLTFSRRVESSLRPVDLNQELKQVERMLRRTIPKMVEIELRLTEPLYTIRADPAQLQQVLVNLAVNARDAMPKGGNLTIETRNVVLDEEYCRTHLKAEPGKYVMVVVTDTGSGIPKDQMNRIFEPFYTTKGVGRGTGLGLAIVYGIVKNHGGNILCYSETGHGTTFKIYLPSVRDTNDADDTHVLPEFKRGTETILLVDDESAVRKLGSSILTRFGYDVLTARSGEEALDVYKQATERIALVILDLIMPGMGGKECLKQLKSKDPDVKVLIASGYAANGYIAEAVREGAAGSIGKPFETRQLLDTVRMVLDTVTQA